MKFTGILSVDSGESSLNGTLLAISGADDPLGEGTNFLANRGLGDGDPAVITGNKGSLGTETVIFMTDAQSAPSPQTMALSAKGAGKGPKRLGKKRAAKSPADKKGKKRSMKKVSKKGVGK